MISNRKNENYNDVINHIRTRIRFSILKSVLVAVRGERGKTFFSASFIGSIQHGPGGHALWMLSTSQTYFFYQSNFFLSINRFLNQAFL